jgi:hypothetical protein
MSVIGIESGWVLLLSGGVVWGNQGSGVVKVAQNGLLVALQA